jgi:hypothetical protein
VPPPVDEDLTLLCARIAAIEDAANASLAAGTTRPFVPVSDSLTDDDWVVVTRLARAVGRAAHSPASIASEAEHRSR